MLSLERVKEYLRVDSDFDDTEIQNMIWGAETYFSNETNHIFGIQEKDYFPPFRIYDFPIIDTSTLTRKPNYYIPTECPTTDFITLEVGYATEGAIPNDIVQCLLQIIKVWYYESEKETSQSGSSNTSLLPMSVKQVIEKYRRFLI
jgi:hypothetical protein